MLAHLVYPSLTEDLKLSLDLKPLNILKPATSSGSKISEYILAKTNDGASCVTLDLRKVAAEVNTMPNVSVCLCVCVCGCPPF